MDTFNVSLKVNYYTTGNSVLFRSNVT